MKTWLSSKEILSKITREGIVEYSKPALFANTSSSSESDLPEELSDWLGRLRLLYGLPFEYLIPDERLLPNESIRYFYLDRNWTDRLVDGALSVGKTTSREYTHHTAIFDSLNNYLDSEERVIRDRLRNQPKESKGAYGDITGFLLRSSAVSGWPGLEVKAYSGEQAKDANALKLLRMDRLAPDMLLCLFDGIPDIVDIEEPREGIQFGVDGVISDDGYILGTEKFPSGFYLKMRHITGDHSGYEVGFKHDPVNGEPIDGINTGYIQSVPVRKANPQVLHMEKLAEVVEEQLDSIFLAHGEKFGYDGDFTSSDLGVQLLQFPYQQRFQGQGKSVENDSTPYLQLLSTYSGANIPLRTFVERMQEDDFSLLDEISIVEAAKANLDSTKLENTKIDSTSGN